MITLYYFFKIHQIIKRFSQKCSFTVILYLRKWIQLFYCNYIERDVILTFALISFRIFFSLSLFFYTIRCSFILFFKINSVLCSLSFLDLFIIPLLFQIFLLFLFLFFWHSCFMYVMSFVTVSQFLDNLGFCFLVFFLLFPFLLLEISFELSSSIDILSSVLSSL